MGNRNSTKSGKIDDRRTNLILRKPCIGDDGFSVQNIVNILSNTPNFASFVNNWRNLALALEINPVRYCNWQAQLLLGIIDISTILSNILEEWAEKSTNSGAEISILIDKLKSKEMNDMADRLQLELKVKYPNLGTTNSDGVVINIVGSGLHNTSLAAEHSSISLNHTSEVEREGLLTQKSSTETTSQTRSSAELSQKKKKSKLRQSIISLAILVLIISITIIIGLILHFRILLKSETKTQMTSLVKSCLQHELINENTENNEKMFLIEAASYYEYQDFSEHLPDNQPISLAIKLNGKGQWPHGVPLAKPCSIKELNITGSVDLNFLSWILNQTTQIQSIDIQITNLSECDGYDTQQSVTVLNQDYVSLLPNLITLTLSHSCVHTWMYKFFSSVSMKDLEIFKVNNGIINDVNIQYLRSIHKQSKKLKMFHLIARLDTNQLFYPTGHESTSLKEVRIDNITTSHKSKYSRLILGEDFCDTFPELEVFQSTNSCVSFNDRYKIFGCMSLKQLTISICYTSNEYYSLRIVQKLSHLEKIDLYLVFPKDNCPPPDESNRVRQEVNNSTVKSKRVCSNCIIHSTRESYCTL